MASNIPDVITTAVPPTRPSDVQQCGSNIVPDSDLEDSESEREYEYDDKATEVSTCRGSQPRRIAVAINEAPLSFEG
jgi:hypothetical protein